MDDSAFLIVQLVACVICGVIAAVIASNKGRSGVGWFFAGCLLGIMGIIIVACLGNLHEQRRRDEYVARENRRLREQLMQEQMKGEAFRRHTAARLDIHDQQLGFDTRTVATALPSYADPFQLPGFGGPTPLALEAMPLQSANPQAGSAQPPTNGQAPPPAALNGTAGANNPPVPQRFEANPPAFGVAPPPPPASRPVPSAPNAMPQIGPKREWYYEVVGQSRGPIGDSQLVALVKSGEIKGATLVWTEDLGDWKPASQVKALTPYLTRT